MKAHNLFIKKDESPDGDCPYVLIGSHDPNDGMDGAVAHVFGDDEAAAEKLAREILDQMSLANGGESGMLEVNDYQLMGGGRIDDVVDQRIVRHRQADDSSKWAVVDSRGFVLNRAGNWERQFVVYVPDRAPDHLRFDTPDEALRCWQTAVMRNVHDGGDSQEGKPDDLAFLKEIQERLTAGVEGRDPTQIEYAREMVRDWVDELEGSGKAKEPVEDGRPNEVAVRDILSLVDRYVPLEYLKRLSDAELNSALLWASAVHLEANDNDVEVPPMPLWLANYLPDNF